MNTQALHPEKLRGFTLIELMIVVAIIGVLAAVAYPQYLKSMQKSHRADGQTSLTKLGQSLERCYTVNFNYQTPACPGVTPTPSPATSAAGFYTLAVSATTATYTITATAIGSQTKDTGCTSLTLNNTGTQSPPSCWSN